MSDLIAVQGLLACWWYGYDQGDFEAISALLTDDIAFTVRSDSGATPYEDFIRCDTVGRSDVMAWQRDHRLNSPYPLRHNATNIHLTGRDGSTVLFASYIFVTHVVNAAPAPLSSGIVTGAARLEGSSARLAEMNVVLDMTDSITFAQR